MDSILTSTKKTLGITEACTDFDADLIDHINSAFSILNQLGVGPVSGFAIEDKNDEWTDFMAESPKLNLAKEYLQKKVRIFFDPPDKGSLMDSTNNTIKELEWRLTIAADPIVPNGGGGSQNVGV